MPKRENKYTWRHAIIVILLVVASLFSAVSHAGIPTYHTLSGVGNPATPAAVIFPADPNSQIRIVTVNYTADTNTAVLNMSSGTTAYSLISTNDGMVTNVITSTNGLNPTSLVFLQHAGVVYTNSPLSWSNTGTNTYTQGGVTVTNSVTTLGANGNGPVGTGATNLNLLVIANAWPVNANMGDEIYIQGAVSSVWLGANTNWIDGDDIFNGSYGRPVMLQIAGYSTVSPATGTNRLNSVGAHFDSASQP